jgi:hypothetical protein
MNIWPRRVKFSAMIRFPYGIKANKNMLQTIVDYSHEQGLTKNKFKLEELFAPATLEL